MFSERLLSRVVRMCTNQYLKLSQTDETHVPAPVPGQRYMLYMHVPFCERLCPYCSFNRFPFSEDRARPYFANMRKEMLMLKDLGYDFDSVYIGGGTPTILLDELCDTIDLARETFSIKEVSSETNPNHLIPSYLDKLQGRVQRLSVGVQSFDDGLLKQMDRYDKYGSGEEILARIQDASPYFVSMNADMIFNFPAQTEDILLHDIEKVIESNASQTTFYPLMASPSVERSLARTVGKVDYQREQRFYEIICEILTGELPGIAPNPAGPNGEVGLFEFGSAWTFNRRQANAAGVDVTPREEVISPFDGFEEPAVTSEILGASTASTVVSPSGAGSSSVTASSSAADGASDSPSIASSVSTTLPASEPNSARMIDEYVVDYEEYPAIGSGGITYLGENLYVNTFSVKDYNAAIESGRMSLMGRKKFSKKQRMMYRFMMQLFGLRLDKRQFKRDFGCSVEWGLPEEMAFMTAAGAFATNNDEELTLTPKGRYLCVVMMRQFFIGVNNLRDQARAALTGEERELLFGE